MLYRTVCTVGDGRRDYPPGSWIELEPDAARQLLDAGAVETLPGDAADAVRSLDRDDPGLWTSDGKPRVEALEAALGREVAAAERDAAWETVEAGKEDGA